MSRVARVTIGVVVCAAVFAAGWWLGSRRGVPSASLPTPAASEEAEVWTCAMHPQIQLPRPGLCPICAMDLVPVDGGAGQDEGRELVFSETARRLAGIRTAVVERRPVTVEVRMVGKVDYDETRIATITSYVPGRLDRMYVDAAGVPVRKGDHLVDIYSPELIAAQGELLQAIDAERRLRDSDLEIMRRTAIQTVEAARERLRLWGLLPEQIEEIESRGSATERITIYSPMAGVVIEKHANLGSYVETGTPIYTIADLDHLWVRLDAYESDIEWVHLGQLVEFTTEAYPGVPFEGRVSFVDPVMDPRTRTVRLRVNVSNEQRRLKPEMLVRAEVQSRVAGEGLVFDPYLAGKWISPMHPEVVKDGPGSCDVCGMDLVRAESLGYAADAGSVETPLVIPASAPLVTGERAVVYVETPGAERPTYEGREVVLGPRAGDVYIVREGLERGERVVVEGAFKIDSALQIQARPSMMSAPEVRGEREQPARAHALPEELVERLDLLYECYLALQQALAADDLEQSRAALRSLDEGLHVETAGLPEAAAASWRRTQLALHSATTAAMNATDLASLRLPFRDLSQSLVELAGASGHATDADLVVAFCPMVQGGGASWLQSGETIANPYYGATMLRCGEVRERIERRGGR